MNELFEDDSLVDCTIELGAQEDFTGLESRPNNDSSALKSMTHRRQIEIMWENKLLKSSLKDIYDY